MPIAAEDLLHPTPSGLYCPEGNFFVDPHRPVERAVITHGHADHARPGHAHVLATPETLGLMQIRYGDGAGGRLQALPYGEALNINGVRLRLTPAGHVLGSAQAVIEHGGTRIVVSGDYKRRRDPTCTGFEPVACDVFITEATFALPVFRHPDDADEVARLLASVATFPGRTHLVGAYALGKAQRLIALLRAAGWDKPVWLHGAAVKLTDWYRAQGIGLGDVRPVTAADKGDLAGGIVVAPPSALADRWSRRLSDPVTCFASGWMRVRARARQRGVELPLVISDHADWDELTRTVAEIAPGELWVTHGRDDALIHWAHAQGIPARPLALVGRGEDNDDG
ncbi:ligase-associated DNA damage response exonuclease [Futiania mangrovi]|uniref:Ligase-associated DNA damage response exonuclease n=1 Tax=Futiania mangrovi TaxID=2959716 RepID=A0A9J6PD09_9PROT|nr:ligase-associated DNA damage response exonuclease [Futiania mangrovii]MCP1336198.1 ligase-associated DNA damage response exonuclease [Futiania mangrovii]